MSALKSKKSKGPTKDQIEWMLSIKTTTRYCRRTTDRIRAARKKFSEPTEYMRDQQRSLSLIMHQAVGQPIQRYR